MNALLSPPRPLDDVSADRIADRATSLVHYQLYQELHRERLHQAEQYRLRRAALRARRALAQPLMR